MLRRACFAILVVILLSPNLCLTQGRGGVGLRSTGMHAFTHGAPPLRIAHPRPAGMLLSPTLLTVPQTYPTIQSAIDAAFDGDTVLVSEGTYFEQIRYRGKAITVASLYIVDGDTTHIERTIIDGSKSSIPDSGSVVYLVNDEDTTSVLCGLTIQGGTGTQFFYSDVWIRGGGGIFCHAAGVRLVRNIIRHNRVIARVAGGGGLETLSTTSFGPHMILDRNRITDNYVESDTNSSWNGWSAGADLFGDCWVVGNVFERDTAVGNNGACGGGMILQPWDASSPLSSAYIARNLFRSNIVKSAMGISSAAGLGIVWTADVIIQENLFESNAAFTAGVWATGGGLYVGDYDITGYGRKVILKNRFLSNTVDCTGLHQNEGGGLSLYRTLATVSGNEFADNRAVAQMWGGGGIYIGDASFCLENNIFIRNSTGANGGGICVEGAPQFGIEQVFVNNTVVENHAFGVGGGLMVNYAPHFVALNNILWNNAAGAGGADLFVNASIIGVDYCDVKDGWPGEGNISVDPRFLDGAYRLSDSSGCIGAAVDSLQIAGIWYRASGVDYAGSTRPNPPGSYPDIGAWEHPLPVPVGASAVSVKPLLYDFQNVHPGSVSDTISVIITNKGSTQREISLLSLGNKGFLLCAMPALPVMIPPYHNLQLEVVFAPKISGQVVCDTLVLTTSDPLLPRATVLLTGRGADAVRSASPGVLYGIAGSDESLALYEVDRKSGQARLNAHYSPRAPTGVNAFTVRHRDSTIYAAFPSGSGTDLYRLSSQCGDLELVCTVPLSQVTSMAFSSSDALYLATGVGKIYRSQTPLWDTAYVGSTVSAFTGLAFSPSTGILWASSHDSIYTIDASTGSVSFVGAKMRGIVHSSITFSPAGTLYALFDNSLVALDRSTAEPFNIGNTGATGLHLIAMRSDLVSGIEDPGLSPLRFELSQNFPNPFNPSTAISYQLSAVSFVTLRVFDILGREVAVLVNERQLPGRYNVRFDGGQLATGIYFYRMRADGYTETRKMLLIR